MADTLTITDNRTGKKYEIPIQDGTIRAIDRMKEREQVHSTEEPGQRSLQQLTESVQCAAEPVGIRDELNLILH